jgi:hypothetical protein
MHEFSVKDTPGGGINQVVWTLVNSVTGSFARNDTNSFEAFTGTNQALYFWPSSREISQGGVNTGIYELDTQGSGALTWVPTNTTYRVTPWHCSSPGSPIFANCTPLTPVIAGDLFGFPGICKPANAGVLYTIAGFNEKTALEHVHAGECGSISGVGSQNNTETAINPTSNKGFTIVADNLGNRPAPTFF